MHVVAVQQRLTEKKSTKNRDHVQSHLIVIVTYYFFAVLVDVAFVRVSQAPSIVPLEGEHSSPAISGYRRDFFGIFLPIFLGKTVSR